MDPENVAGEFAWRRLKTLTVGPFRGFRREETFDFQKRIVLFYGPNGSGKTSLCEALERAMLGSVEEAELKRIAENNYLANIHAGRFVEPRLVGVDAQGREVAVAANADAHRFCFVEKNRIDSFSRIAARPTVQRAELIATLFGMEKFSDFANHFNDSMDPELVRQAEKQIALNAKRTALARDQATVNSEATNLAQHDLEDATYAETYAPDTTYARLKELIGDHDAPGRLHALQEILNAAPPAVTGLTRQTLVDAYQAVNDAAARLRDATLMLDQRSSQVSFRALYTAVSALQTMEADHCPACDTPLERATRDPYAKARTGLEGLRDLAALQEEQARHRESLADNSVALRARLASIAIELDRRGETDGLIGSYLIRLPTQPHGDTWWMAVYATDAGSDGAGPSVEQILDLVDTIAVADAATRLHLVGRAAFVRERDALLTRQTHIQERDLRRQMAVRQAAEARGRIAAFDAENAMLIQGAEQERLNIERDRPIKAAYDQFLPYLRRFKDQLPAMLMGGLNELAIELYNEFNYEDHENDRLAALHLPLNGEQRIEISFLGAPGRRVDALALLSEGHIRCLGLAILLAKALSLRSPLIIFDDAINAIDTDHRRGIRQTIFDSDRFRDMQFIVTCHSGEFIKDVQNSLPAHSQNDWREYLLRHHHGDHHPRVTANAVNRNYVAKARAARELLNDRDALASCRQALEMLTNRVWVWMQGNNLGLVRIEIGRSGGEPSLNNLCVALRKRLADAQTFAHEHKQPVINALDLILGIPELNLVWTYLNKGTHEEDGREDFDSAHVETAVQTIEALAALDLRRQRR